ncbi:MAG: hypothetical protein GX089_08730 [Fibrobacter sp.]|jgi:hypothetical protein|nr:hypothetical protein [Fibrobacter sp.]
MREGLLGLLLYLTHWLAPEADRASIDARFVRFIDEQTISFNCQMEIAWNKRLEQLVDAGIPLRFRIASFSDKSDTVLFYRSLFFDVVNYTYTFSDSGGWGVQRSNPYPLIHLALRDFCRWEVKVPRDAMLCRVDVQILPSKAEQLNRMVDMSKVWGRQKVLFRFNPQEKIKRKAGRKK